jgi:hypothetical protein
VNQRVFPTGTISWRSASAASAFATSERGRARCRAIPSPEANAHLHFLERAGRVRRARDADGVARFAPAKETAWKNALTA